MNWQIKRNLSSINASIDLSSSYSGEWASGQLILKNFVVIDGYSLLTMQVTSVPISNDRFRNANCLRQPATFIISILFYREEEIATGHGVPSLCTGWHVTYTLSGLTYASCMLAYFRSVLSFPKSITPVGARQNIIHMRGCGCHFNHLFSLLICR